MAFGSMYGLAQAPTAVNPDEVLGPPPGIAGPPPANANAMAPPPPAAMPPMPGAPPPANANGMPPMPPPAAASGKRPTTKQLQQNADQTQQDYLRTFDEQQQLAGEAGDIEARKQQMVGEQRQAGFEEGERRLQEVESFTRGVEDKYSQDMASWQKEQDAYAQEKYDPQSLWKNADTASQIAASIGVGLGYVAQGLLGGGENPALAQIDKAIDRDYRSWEESHRTKGEALKNKQSAINQMHAAGIDSGERKLRFRALALQNVENKIASMEPQFEGDKQRNAAAQMKADIGQKRAAINDQIAQQRLQQRTREEAAAASAARSRQQQMLKLAKDMREEERQDKELGLKERKMALEEKKEGTNAPGQASEKAIREYGEAVDKAGISDVDTSVAALERTIAKYPKGEAIPGLAGGEGFTGAVGGAIRGSLAPAALSQEGRDNRRMWKDLNFSTLKMLSGAGVPIEERKQFEDMMAQARTSDDIREAVRYAREKLEDRKSKIATNYGGAAVANAYNERLNQTRANNPALASNQVLELD